MARSSVPRVDFLLRFYSSVFSGPAGLFCSSLALLLTVTRYTLSRRYSAQQLRNDVRNDSDIVIESYRISAQSVRGIRLPEEYGFR